MRATALTLAAAALAAGTFLLTGCEPGDTVTFNGSGTYNAPDTSDGLGVDCDPSGFGPLSGCASSSGAREQSPPATEDKPAPGQDDSADKTTEAEPAPCPDDSHNLDLGAGRFDDKNSGDCDNNSDANSYQSWDQKITEGRYDITVTWIVVNIKFTGFRECVLDLREAAAKSEDHFARHVTSPEDCKAQQVHTVYRPVVTSGK
ncbi:MAG: hypothetical protein ACRDRV_14190 [Pseudonocardiaceae bacterium]